ncbi:MAG: SGNH/GDSL hydrolase family protein [Vicinamibacterales bacterium]
MRLSRLLLFCGIAVGQFALFEAGLRLKGGTEAAPAFQALFMPDDRIGYRLRPGAAARFATPEFETDIAINSAGVRDAEIGPKEAGERRIVVLGDSLVLAVQVPREQTFCEQLEARLNRNPAAAGHRYRVINAGVQGYGPVEEWLFYTTVAASFDADLVLVGLYPANDAIEAADSAFKMGGTVTEPPPMPARERIMRVVRRIVRRSMVLQIARLRATTFLERLGRRAPIERPLTSYLATPPRDFVHGLDVTREAMERLIAEAAGHGGRTALVLLPARFQVKDEDYEYLREAVEAHGDVLVRNAATERFKTALAGLGAPVIDLLPPFERHADPASLYFESTAHFTAAGHAYVAQVIESSLLELGLVPPAPPASLPAER